MTSNPPSNSKVSISDLSAQMHAHAARCADHITRASDRQEHIRATQVALEASRLALELDRYISQNTQPGTGPVVTVPCEPSM